MMILALDAATKTGWCLLKDGKLYESGVQDFSKKRGESNGAMFFRFRNWLHAMLEIGVAFVVYERAHHRGGASTELLVNLTGRIQEVCSERDIDYAAIHTAELKKWATGSGGAKKEAMKEKAKPYLGRDPADDNEADAVLLAYKAWEDYGHNSKGGV